MPTSSLDAYIARSNSLKPLTRDEELALFERYSKLGDRQAKAALLGAHLRHVVAIALKYRRYQVPLDELVAEGNLAVAHALSKFDPTRGTRFVTYASYWIRAHILNHVIGSHSLVGVGSGALRSKLFFKLRRERARLRNLVDDEERALGELAEKVNLPVRKVADMVRRLESRDLSLDSPLSRDTTTTLLDALVSPDDQERELARLEQETQRTRLVKEALACLDDRERFIAAHRWMADAENELSLSAIGRRLGVSRERARQLEQRAKTKLRARLEQLSLARGHSLDELVAA